MHDGKKQNKTKEKKITNKRVCIYVTSMLDIRYSLCTAWKAYETLSLVLRYAKKR